MNLFKVIHVLGLSIILSACSVYKSPDRKDFESDYASFKLQNINESDCSYESVRPIAEASKLVTITKSHSGESVFLWEYKINNQTYFESDNLKGIYCIYENT